MRRNRTKQARRDEYQKYIGWYKAYEKTPLRKKGKNVYLKKYWRQLKLEVFGHYCRGRIRCQCKRCPIRHIDLLSLDHIVPVRSKTVTRGYNLWMSLRRLGYPKGFQILCIACNKAKNTRKQCPRYGKKH
jgi:5-methylcytosine-specific restriction endonuclease McrA